MTEAKENNHPNQPFDPYDGLCDPSNINYRHAADYREFQHLVNSLPPGWKRAAPAEVAAGQPPYVHEPSGVISWKNPNFRAIMDAADEQRMKTKGAGGEKKLVVKRLRLLLANGAPLGAVEQRARLEGIDMALVLSPSSGDADAAASADSDDEEDGHDGVAIPETLAKKYRRMFKAGTPLGAVQQLADREAGASAEQVAALVRGDATGRRGVVDAEGGAAGAAVDAPAHRLAKFVRMKKAGVPPVAIRNAARLQGFDADEVSEALGLRERADADVDQKAALATPTGQQRLEVEARRSATTSPATPPAAGSRHFVLREGDRVSFPHQAPLAALVRKMVQTVQKTSRFDTGAAGEHLVVDEETLYHALGSLKGVQFARDEYNSTLGAGPMEEELIHAKRQGYTEMVASIGATVTPPTATCTTCHVGIAGLDELVRHIETVNRVELERGRALTRDGSYDFDTLHALYPIGSHVVAKHAGGAGIDCVCQVIWHRYTQGRTISGKTMKYFELCTRFIAPVAGARFTFAEVVEGVEMFEGPRSLAASAGGAGLAFVPPPERERDELRRRHGRRGALCCRLARADGASYLAYAPGSFFQKRGGGATGAPAAALAAPGRVVVDVDAARDHGHAIGVGRDDMLEGLRLKIKEHALHLRAEDARRGTGGDGGDMPARGMILFRTIPEEYLALTWPTTVGFSLTSKSWGDVVIDGLSDIAFDPTVFGRLVLPPSRKRMIKALVKHTNASGFHDLVQGKGEGTCFLLHGEPGTGKTLTAEAIAESLHCPLYSMSMGTLGTTAEELERRLKEILELSARWNALVLLDEADSFLETRSATSSLERNAMVSVMLRLVEYHRGILFLTSNRLDSLDPAFRTRITLALRYEPLDAAGRAQVWDNLLRKSGAATEALDVPALAVTPLNGREIKNALRLAMALAAEEGGALSQELLLETSGVIVGHKAEDHVKPGGWLPHSSLVMALVVFAAGAVAALTK